MDLNRKDLFFRLKRAMNELDREYEVKNYFKYSTEKLNLEVLRLEDLVEDLEENMDFRMYRAT